MLPIDQLQDPVFCLKGKHIKVDYCTKSELEQLFGLVMRDHLVESGAIADRLGGLEGALTILAH